MPVTLSELLQSLYGVRSRTVENPETATVGVTVVNILRNNPNRLSFTIFNLSANNIWIGPKNDVSSTKGIWVSPNGGSVTLMWDRDFEIVGAAWYAIAAGAGSAIYLLENIAI